MGKIRIALIGCGTIANGRHIPAYKMIEDLEVKYCCDLIKSRAEEASEQFGAKAIVDYHEILDSDEIDAVTICTPNFSHEQISCDFAKHGKHVLCEKPLAIDYEVAKNIKSVVDSSHVILDVGVCNRYRKAVIKVKEIIDSGAIGEIYHVNCNFRKHRAVPGLGGAYTTKAENGGGVLIDWGVHFFDLMLFALGLPDIKSVSSVSYNKLSGNIKDYEYISMWAGPKNEDGICDVEDTISGLMRTSKATINFNGAWAQNLDDELMVIEFLGDKGGIKLDYYDKFTVYTNSKDVFYTCKADFNDNDMFYSEIKAFVNSIKTGVKNNNNIEYVMELSKALDAIYASAKLGKEVVL